LIRSEGHFDNRIADHAADRDALDRADPLGSIEQSGGSPLDHLIDAWQKIVEAVVPRRVGARFGQGVTLRVLQQQVNTCQRPKQ
jgi:hypothetical protein